MDTTAAVARLNAIRFHVPAPEVARRLAIWQLASGGLVVPRSVRLAPLEAPESSEGEATDVGFFRERAQQFRSKIARALGLPPEAARHVTFLMQGELAWYLGAGTELARSELLDAVAVAPERYIKLMLLRELIESAAYDPDHVFVTGGFGPGVYIARRTSAWPPRPPV
ncbi:hypothetical protein AWV80_00250 [Cupriavidus sp. UYMU48A]|nr:hypothetical protein AWV80_00250 [Cupriavidus sp. UYMU48A]